MCHIKYFIFAMFACAISMVPIVGIADVIIPETDADADSDADSDSDSDADGDGDADTEKDDDDTDDESDDESDNDDDDADTDDGGDDASCSFTAANSNTALQFALIACMFGVGIWLWRRKK